VGEDFGSTKARNLQWRFGVKCVKMHIPVTSRWTKEKISKLFSVVIDFVTKYQCYQQISYCYIDLITVE
jgi:hypothetical protein